MRNGATRRDRTRYAHRCGSSCIGSRRFELGGTAGTRPKRALWQLNTTVSKQVPHKFAASGRRNDHNDGGARFHGAAPTRACGTASLVFYIFCWLSNRKNGRGAANRAPYDAALRAAIGRTKTEEVTPAIALETLPRCAVAALPHCARQFAPRAAYFAIIMSTNSS